MPPHNEAILSYLVMTLIYYGLAFPFVEYVLNVQEPPWWRAATWFGLVIAGPAILGMALGIGAQLGPVRWLLRKFGLNPIHPSPTAWDWRFGNMPEQWVIITLKDGTKFAGFCSEKSFFSSDPAERDIYVEKIYTWGDKDEWIDVGDKSLFIAHGQIRTIEFLPVDRKEYEDDSQTAGTSDDSGPEADHGGVSPNSAGRPSAHDRLRCT